MNTTKPNRTVVTYETPFGIYMPTKEEIQILDVKDKAKYYKTVLEPCPECGTEGKYEDEVLDYDSFYKDHPEVLELENDINERMKAKWYATEGEME